MSNLPTSSALSDGSAAGQHMSASTNLPALASSQMDATPNTYGSIVAGGSGDVEMTHATGNIISLTNPVKAGSTGYTRVDQMMADSSFGESLRRNVKIVSITDFSTAGSQTKFRPWALWSSNAFVGEKLKNFNYIRGGIVLSGVFKGPALSSGLAVITAIPCYERADANINLPPMLSMVPLHVLVDMSSSSDFELTLPWMVASDYGNLEDNLFQGSWVVVVTVMDGLRSAIPEGCASANLTIMARPADDFELAGATFESSKERRPAVSRSKPHTSGASKPGGKMTVDSINDTVRGYTGGYKASEVASTVAWGAGLSAMVPALTPFAAPVAAAAAGVASFLSMFGFTRETKVVSQDEAQVRAIQNLMNVDGCDTSHVGALFSTNALSRDPAINGALSAMDEASFAFINSRYTQIATLEFTVGDPTSADYVIPVTPCIGAFNLDGTKYTPTTGGYLASRFNYWRGDMKYLFYPVLSPVHRGALQVLWQPIPRDAATPIDLTNLSVNTIMDMAAAQPYEITVGYNNDNPMCFTDFYTVDTPFSTADYDQLNGYLRVRSLIPFSGSDCGTTISVLVFAAAGENMQYGNPTDSISFEGDYRLVGYDVESEVILQSGVVGADGQGLVHVDLIPSSGAYPIADILMGEEIVSVRTLLQKPSLIRDIENDRLLIPDGEFEIEHWYTGGNANVNCVNLIEYYGSMFLGMAGSIRYKYLLDKGSFQSTLPTVGPLTGVPLIGREGDMSMSFPLCELNPIVTSETLAAELTVPYYYREKFIAAYKAPSRGNDQIQWLATGMTFRCQLYRSAGPDLRLTVFRAQNRWVFTVPTGFLDPKNIWTEVEIAGGGDALARAPALARSSELTPEEVADLTAKQEIAAKKALNQYRARTGRKDYKKPTGSIRPIRPTRTVDLQSKVTHGDFVVAFEPPLRPASRRL